MHAKQRGMSLPELMIAMTIGLMLVMGLATLFTQARQSFRQDEQVAMMQANLRFAIEEVVKDLAMAGFWGGLLDPTDVEMDASLALSTGDCGAGGAAWAFELTPAITGLNNATAAATNAAFDCIAAAGFRAGTDVLAVKRAVGFRIPGDPAACPADYFTADELARGQVSGRVYFADNGVVGQLYTEPADVPDYVDGCVEHRQYSASIWFVQNYSVTAGDGIPTLCRQTLAYSTTANPAVTKECLVEGIEQLQVEYGIDTDGNGIPNRYISAPTTAQFADIVAMRVHVVARSINAEFTYDNPKTYVAGDVTYTPADNFYRRSATTTVVVRNPANLRNLGG